MGTLIVVVCGVTGGFIAAKRNLLQPWIFLINFAVALYASIFLSPILASYVPVKEIPPLLLNLLAMLVCLIIISLVLMKITEAVVSDTETVVDIPPVIAKPIQVCSGFLAGCMISGLLIWAVCLLPYSENFSLYPILRTQSGRVLLSTIKTVDFFSTYTLTSQDKMILTKIGIIYVPPAPPKEKSAVSKPVKKVHKKKKVKKTKKAAVQKVSPAPAAKEVKEEKNPAVKTAAPVKQEKQDQMKSVIPALNEVQIEQALLDEDFSKVKNTKKKKKKKEATEQTDELDEYSFD